MIKETKKPTIDFKTGAFLVFLSLITGICTVTGIYIADGILANRGGLAFTIAIGISPLVVFHAFLSSILNNYWK